MGIRKLVIMLLMGIMLAAGTGYAAQYDRNDRYNEDDSWHFSHVKPWDDPWAPAFSSPRVEMAPNGDRVSPYPPGYRPDRR